jgi:type VI secretion system ImpM family protein
MRAALAPPSQRAALFGKLPWAADYVRIHHVSPAAIALDSWLSAAIQALARARASWPSERVRFLLQVPREHTLLAGVLAASRDRAGRKFPVAVFAALPCASLGASFAALPRLLGPFMDDVDALLDRAPTLDRESTHEAVSALRPPGLGALGAAALELSRELAQLSARQLASALFASTEPASEHARARALSAFCTLHDLTDARRARAPEQAPVLDCPLTQSAALEAWLALARSALRPSVFWTPHASAPRMLLALGTVPPALPLWLDKPISRSDRLLSLAEPAQRTSDARLLRVREDDWNLGIERFAARLTELLAEPGAQR